jgi:ubiquinone/menaquinone biosynthesis C-methylase UbiE
MENINTVMDHYEKRYNENDRLARQPLEFIRTKEIIARFLPKTPIKILDLCGATGHYSYWLAEMGHEVHLVDLSEKHIKEAKKNREKYNASLASINCGDARNVNFDNNTFDIVLLMGALYHLQEQEDRLQCLKETFRILKNNGVAFFAYICRHASMLDGFLEGYIDDPIFCKIMDEDIQSGRHNNPDNKPGYFTNAYFHSTKDIFDELSIINFQDISLYAVEGFAGLMNIDEYMKNKEKLEKLLHYLRLTEQNMEMMGISLHQLAVCKKHFEKGKTST